MAEAPLSALCSVCYANPPKYRCPRCPGPVRTCSLPCYKRHQQRASCNGQRDPTTYVRSRDLATPAGFDHDYNFLTKIENALETPEKDGETSLHSNVRRRWNADGAFRRYLKENRISVDKAPIGMSRQKQNQSRQIQRSKRIVWTIEWVDVDGEKRLSEVDQSSTIGDAYAQMMLEKSRASKKRKRVAEDNPSSDRGSADTVKESAGQDEEDIEASHAQAVHGDDEVNSALDVPLSQSDNQTIPSSDAPTSYLYLHKPHTSGTSRVVIPISDKTRSITSVLSDQAVLEFPTFHALMEPPDKLPAGFMTEKTYFEGRKEEDGELKDLLATAPHPARGVRGGSGPGTEDGVLKADDQQLDQEMILEMLRRDVRA